MSGEHELPTASVVRSSQATPARRRGQARNISLDNVERLARVFGMHAYELLAP